MGTRRVILRTTRKKESQIKCMLRIADFYLKISIYYILSAIMYLSEHISTAPLSVYDEYAVVELL